MRIFLVPLFILTLLPFKAHAVEKGRKIPAAEPICRKGEKENTSAKEKKESAKGLKLLADQQSGQLQEMEKAYKKKEADLFIQATSLRSKLKVVKNIVNLNISCTEAVGGGGSLGWHADTGSVKRSYFQGFVQWLQGAAKCVDLNTNVCGLRPGDLPVVNRDAVAAKLGGPGGSQSVPKIGCPNYPNLGCKPGETISLTQLSEDIGGISTTKKELSLEWPKIGDLMKSYQKNLGDSDADFRASETHLSNAKDLFRQADSVAKISNYCVEGALDYSKEATELAKQTKELLEIAKGMK